MNGVPQVVEVYRGPYPRDDFFFCVFVVRLPLDAKIATTEGVLSMRARETRTRRGRQGMTRHNKEKQAQRIAEFDACVSHYEAALLRYVGRIVNNRDSAQDVVQNTFIRLFRRWQEDLTPSQPLSAWLYRVAHNCAVDYLRSESRRHVLHQRQAEELPTSAPANRGRGFHISDEAEQAAVQLKRLTLREQQLVVLKVYEEKSYKEISEITGLTVSNVGYILHHAMKDLAAMLKDPGTQ